MSDQIEVQIGNQDIMVVVEGGALGIGMSVAQAELNVAVGEAKTAADDAQAAAVVAVNATAGKADVGGGNVAALGQQAAFRGNIAAVGSAALLSSSGGSLVGNSLPAGANLRTQTYAEFVDGGTIQPTMFAGTEEQQFLRAIVEAGTVRNDGLGQTVVLPRGEMDVTAPFNLENRVTVAGVNKRGSIIRAASGFSGSYMATVVNSVAPTGSTFDNPLRDLTLNCNDVVGLGGVLSDAWQEGGGVQRVLIQKFRTYGIYLKSGYGGASTILIDGAEIFGSGVGGGATCGLYCEQIALDGGFLVHVTNTTVSGDNAAPMGAGIEMENDSLHCHAVHFEECDYGIVLDGAGDSVLIGVTGATTVPTVVRIRSTFTGTLTMLGCSRQGSTNLVVDDRIGGLGTITWDTDVKIKQDPVVGLGEVVACGNFNGNLASPNLDYSYGIASAVKGTAGVYTFTLSRPGVGANSFSVVASSITPDATVTVELLTASTFRLTHRSGGNNTDTIEIKFIVTRCA